MTNIIWYVNAERQKLLDALEEIPEYGRRKRSEIIEMAIREFVTKHGKSNNPQTTISMYDRDTINAIPNVYGDETMWKKFYQRIKNKKDFSEVDSQLMMILRLHNRRDKQIGI
jgi:hypothetical protein